MNTYEISDSDTTHTSWLDAKRQDIEKRHDDNKVLLETIYDNIKLIGHDLFEVRQRLKPIGQWSKWCEGLSFSYETALNYITFYEAYGQSVTVTDYDFFTLRDLYTIAKQVEPERLLAAKTKAKQGAKLDSDEIDVILDYEKIVDSNLRVAFKDVNEANPRLISECLASGVIMNLDGDDIPLVQADVTLVKVIADEDTYERVKRQKEHIRENSKSIEIAAKAYRLGAYYRIESDMPLPDDFDFKVYVKVSDNEQE